MSDDRVQHSVTQRKRRFTVAASPMNAVKLELALICGVAILLWLVQSRISDDPAVQFLLLAGYGLASMAWIVFRVRRVVIKAGNDHGKK